ncbi:TPA: hypothetical protein ACH3X1_005103 [Trebouxia sp. C0004]
MWSDQYAKAKKASNADSEQESCSAHDGQRLSFKVPMHWLVLARLSFEQETLQTHDTLSLTHSTTRSLDICLTLGPGMYSPERLHIRDPFLAVGQHQQALADTQAQACKKIE